MGWVDGYGGFWHPCELTELVSSDDSGCGLLADSDQACPFTRDIHWTRTIGAVQAESLLHSWHASNDCRMRALLSIERDPVVAARVLHHLASPGATTLRFGVSHYPLPYAIEQRQTTAIYAQWAWWHYHRPMCYIAVARRWDEAPPTPLLAALSSVHPDPDVQVRAINAMAQDWHGDLLPFLTIAAADRQEPVRRVALGLLAELLATRPLEVVPAVARLLWWVRRPRHGQVVAELIEAAIGRADRPLFEALQVGQDTAVRRLAYAAAISRQLLTLAELVGDALRHPDLRICVMAGEQAAMAAIVAGRLDLLDLLTSARRGETRRAAYQGLALLGQPYRWRDAVDDPWYPVRAMAAQALAA
jgi:hypothetical protein